MPRFIKCPSQSTDDHAAYDRGITKAHFGLGWVNIDVDFRRWNVEEECNHSMPIAGQHVCIRPPNRTREQAILDRAAVDEKILVIGHTPIERGETCHTRQTKSLALEIQTDTRVCQCTVGKRRNTVMPCSRP